MKKPAIVGVLCLLMGIETAQAQEHPHRCSTFERHQELMGDPEYAFEFEEKMNRIADYQRAHTSEAKMDCDDVLYLPVAVHFQDVTIDLACGIDMALDQVERLNLDFAGNNTDLNKFTDNQNIWPGTQQKGSCIQFCLATLNHPDGVGIAEGSYAVTVNQYGPVDDIPEWAGYLNLFVRDMANPLGYSPLGGNGNGDGVVVGITYFGSISCGGNNIDGTYSLGRTATHEIGHYLSLSHPFDSGDCTTDGDGIADTPLTDAATYGCYPDGDEIINCTDPILWPSYMDYVDDACMYMFSEGQVDQMEAHVNANLQNLLDNSATKCQEAACVGFSAQASKQDETCAGEDGTIQFNVVGGNDPIEYSIDGGANFSSSNVFENLESGSFELYLIDASGCEFSDNIELQRETPPINLIESKPAFCGDNSGRVRVDVNHEDEFEFQISGRPWQSDGTFESLTSGTYQVSVRNDADCTNSLEVVVGDESNIRIIEGEISDVNCPLIDNGTISLGAIGVTPPFYWRLNDGPRSQVAEYTNLSPGTYTVSIEDDANCRAERTYEIGLSYTNIGDDCPCELYIPNAMTPDGDGLNDLFEVVPSCPVVDFNLTIFNRWGELIFESDDINSRWNGGSKDEFYVPNEIYFYRIVYRWGESYNEGVEPILLKGYVHTLR